MLCGPLAYNTIHRNLEGALPSLVSTNRYIKSSNCDAIEGVLRCEELLKYLTERNLPLCVCLSEDATRIVGRIQYDSKTVQIIGFTSPIDKQTGLPKPQAFPARNVIMLFIEILDHFSAGNTISNNVIVVMAQPLAKAPPFCLAIFGTDGKYTSTDVENRWKFVCRRPNGTYVVSQFHQIRIQNTIAP